MDQIKEIKEFVRISVVNSDGQSREGHLYFCLGEKGLGEFSESHLGKILATDYQKKEVAYG